ncbi:hypothetical protein [Microbacterium thalli]|uniref:Uncharacterized protein n=1 Tax=Microbacterium thalli TaxID=3027921 RepID=A0ABT5SJR5_9MICO|nr:hypothetical protein [Microbacterium thalli]MDD7963070.1 hypothetical protein [Microbacterium thalli]
MNAATDTVSAFQDDDIVAVLGELVCGGQAGKASTDDGDVDGSGGGGGHGCSVRLRPTSRAGEVVR